MKNSYDIVIIGSGPGGYVSAIRASQLGFSIAIIEKNQNLGGTCLNVGCIPSKYLLHSSKSFFLSKTEYHSYGIIYDKLYVDFKKMMKKKDHIINNLNIGLQFLMKKNKIDIYHGLATFKNKNLISVTIQKNNTSIKKEIEFKYCIIATGSESQNYPNLSTNNNKRILFSKDALSINTIPNRLIVIGGGVIGIELSSIYQRLGSKVIILETMDKLISNMDHSLSDSIKKILEKKSIQVETSLLIDNIEILKDNTGICISVIKKHNGVKKMHHYIGDYCLLSIGRIPHTQYLNLDQLGIKQDDKGFILVNQHLQCTTVNNIYAIGDVIGGKMLAHKAEEEGLYVIEYLAGQNPNKLNYNLVPTVIYTYPEVSSVGKTEEEVKKEKIEYNMGIFPMKNLGISKIIDNDSFNHCFVKIISKKSTDEILGIHMIGPNVSEMIMEAAIAMEFRASSEDLYRICYPHPTFSESIKEAALMTFAKKSIHI
ncbi:dihydrolipoyl dehydrogenase [Blattabacterium cuenoti]|uniref:dihydrolipoyl dehydrogenase n=1 Tax=Blattabacterium cuenoti TaxID=1653831 RepID=UPI00163B7596|nr:dihydrolipoyl dehydrogenase [Blattabacterium cuenoti]